MNGKQIKYFYVVKGVLKGTFTTYLNFFHTYDKATNHYDNNKDNFNNLVIIKIFQNYNDFMKNYYPNKLNNVNRKIIRLQNTLNKEV